MIRLYFDYVSPYSYLAWVKLQEIAARHGQAVEPVPILFAALLDARGARGPAEEPVRRAYIIKDLIRKAHELGVPMTLPPAHPFNPLLALRVTSMPMSAEMRHSLIDRLYRATWADGSGIAERAQVEAIARAVGLPETALADAETPENKARLKAQTDGAIADGAFGVPTMIVDGELFFGTDALSHLDRFLGGSDPVDPAVVERWQKLPSAAQRARASDRER